MYTQIACTQCMHAPPMLEVWYRCGFVCLSVVGDCAAGSFTYVGPATFIVYIMNVGHVTIDIFPVLVTSKTQPRHYFCSTM